jgi:MerR family copper efflux transcriptional regulator
MTSRALRIGELAAASGLTRDALRYYERRGLLPRSRRTTGGFREYDGSAVDRVRFIKQAQAHGLSLSDPDRRRSSPVARHRGHDARHEP